MFVYPHCLVHLCRWRVGRIIMKALGELIGVENLIAVGRFSSHSNELYLM